MQIELDLLTTTTGTAGTTCAGDEVMQTKNQKVGSFPFEFIFSPKISPLLLAVVCWIIFAFLIYIILYIIYTYICV